MLRYRRSLIAALTFLTLFGSLITAPPAQARSSEYQKLASTKRKLRDARHRLAALRVTDEQLVATIHEVGYQLDGAKGLLSLAQNALDTLDLQIRAHQRQLAKLTAAQKMRASLVDKRAASLYMMGPGTEVDALFSATSIQDFAEKSADFELVTRADRLNMESLATLSDRTRKARDQLAHEAALQQAARRRVSERISVVWDAYQTKSAAEDTLARRIKGYRDEVRALEAEQRHIEDIIYARGSTETGPISTRGFIWPTHSHHINSPYGPRGGGFHTGVDLQCNSGEGDWAAKAGKVIAAEWGGGYGNMVIIDHGNGVSTLYAHHSRLLVHEGQEVAQGQHVAECGSTGNATGPHLHFEVRINGHYVNPMPYLP